MTVNSTPVDVESPESQPLVDKKPESAWRRVSVALVVAALLVTVGALYTQAYQVLPSVRFLGRRVASTRLHARIVCEGHGSPASGCGGCLRREIFVIGSKKCRPRERGA